MAGTYRGSDVGTFTVTREGSSAYAQVGGLGFIHRNLPIERQAAEVEAVKKYESGMIVDPVTIHPHQKIHEAMEIMRRFRISGVTSLQNCPTRVRMISFVVMERSNR